MNSPGIGTAKLENVLSLHDLAPTNGPIFFFLLLVFSPSYTTTTSGHLVFKGLWVSSNSVPALYW